MRPGRIQQTNSTPGGPNDYRLVAGEFASASRRGTAALPPRTPDASALVANAFGMSARATRSTENFSVRRADSFSAAAKLHNIDAPRVFGAVSSTPERQRSDVNAGSTGALGARAGGSRRPRCGGAGEADAGLFAICELDASRLKCTSNVAR
jgi:hypothetical protein